MVTLTTETYVAPRPSDPGTGTAEGALLGSCMIQPELIRRASAYLTGDEFSSRARPFWDALVDHQDGDVGALVQRAVRQVVSDEGIEFADAFDLVADYCGDCISVTQWKSYLADMLTAYVERLRAQPIQGVHAQQLAELIRDVELRAQSILDPTHQLGSGDISMDVDEFLAELDEPEREVDARFGIHELDEAIGGGLCPGLLHIIGGRPGQGKSALAMAAVSSTCKRGHRVFLASLEMPKRGLITRLGASEALVSTRRKDWSEGEEQAFRQSAREMRSWSLDLCFDSDLETILAKAQESVRGGARLVVVDYIQLVRSRGRKGALRYELIGDVSRALKQFAMEHDVPVLAPAQLSRVDKTSRNRNPIPGLEDLRESGNLEQDGEVILFIHFDGEGGLETCREPTAMANLFLKKNRYGPRDRIRVGFVQRSAKWIPEPVTTWDGSI